MLHAAFLFYYVLRLPQIIWSELYCVITPFKAPTMKTLKQQFYLMSQEKGRCYNVRERRDSTKKGSVLNVHRKVQFQYHSSGLSL